MTRSSDPSYDRVPYPQKSHSGAHIARLEGLATLFDMRPTPVTKCRVLELGCAAGWNLIPQAFDFPGSEFVGVDASARQISTGIPLVESLALKNIELRHTDILKIDASWGKFDYILCHGVYSWVPPEVQQHILKICKENLTPDGVAHVSYNVLPGWHFRGIAREMMLYHAAQFDRPDEQLAQARAVLEFMEENCPKDTAYGQMLSDELRLVHEADDAYLFHDHLEDNNHPIYFHQFCERAESEGLQYLSDVNFSDMLQRHLPRPIRQALANASLVKQEQYMDFLQGTSFRQTLLCHASMPLNRQLHSRVLDNFHLVLHTATKPAPFDFVINSNSAVDFSLGKRSIQTASPASKAAIHELVDRWPLAITLDDLKIVVERRLEAAGVVHNYQGDQLRRELAGGMMESLATGILDFSVHRPTPIISNSPDRPLVSPLVRKQAELSPNVTNLFHRSVALDNTTRELVSRLDGTHSVEDLAPLFSSDSQQTMSSSVVDSQSQPAVAIQNVPHVAEQIQRAIVALGASGLLIEG